MEPHDKQRFLKNITKMMKTALVSIFVSRLRKIPKAKQSLKNKPPDNEPYEKYRSPLDHWRAIIKSILLRQRVNKRSKKQVFGSLSCMANKTPRRSCQTSPITKQKPKLDKCGDRGRRATILGLFPTTGRSVVYIIRPPKPNHCP